MENTKTTSTTNVSNETMVADNRSAVEIWRDFVKSIEFEMESSKN